ncbi:MAG: hypothetical protein HY791_14140 [Deltaproteobacteria bacterium]|nr:hypothetical protein [Deltaproteobacteria bacterium]
MLRVPSIYVRLIGCALLLASCEEEDDTPDGYQVVTALSAEEHRAQFPITDGAHAGADCQTCHGDFDTFARFGCFNCHDHDQAASNTIHGGMTDYAYESEACYRCHPDGTGELSRASHERYFPIVAPAPHGSEDCSGCHKEADRQVVSCIPCHAHEELPMGETHRAVADYRFTTVGCLSCHPRGEITIDAAAHLPFFPIGLGTAHANESCASCHTSADRKVINCLGCHHEPAATNGAHAINDYEYTSDACRDCHGDSQVDRIRAHLPVVVSTGKHAASRVGCLGCHDTKRTDKTWARDFRVFECYECHRGDAGEHREEGVNYPTPPESCIAARCHPRGLKDD